MIALFFCAGLIGAVMGASLAAFGEWPILFTLCSIILGANLMVVAAALLIATGSTYRKLQPAIAAQGADLHRCEHVHAEQLGDRS